MVAEPSMDALEGLMQGLFQWEDGPRKLLAFLAQQAMEAEMQEHHLAPAELNPKQNANFKLAAKP